MNPVTTNPIPSLIQAPNCSDKDSNTTVFIALTGRTYTAPDAFNESRCNGNADLFCEALWLELDALAEHELMERISMDGLLPGDIPVDIVTSRA